MNDQTTTGVFTIRTAPAPAPAPCPTCGRCPTCGSTPLQGTPAWPAIYPWQPFWVGDDPRYHGGTFTVGDSGVRPLTVGGVGDAGMLVSSC